MVLQLHTLRPTERRMYELLLDGNMHLNTELHECLWDELGPIQNIEAHLSSLRKRLRSYGMTVKCRHIDGLTYYQMVRFFDSSE